MTSGKNCLRLEVFFCQARGIHAIVCQASQEERSWYPCQPGCSPDDSFPSSKSFTAAASLSSFPNSSGDIFRASKESSGTCKTISLMYTNVMLIVMCIFASSVSREGRCSRSDKLKNVCIIGINSLGWHEPYEWAWRRQDLSLLNLAICILSLLSFM